MATASLPSVSASLPPGPRTPGLWQTYRFVFQPVSYSRAMRETYGDAVSFKSLLGQGVAIFEAGLAREVFAAPPETFETAAITEALFGRSAVIAVAGDKHKRLRRLLNPRFHGSQVRGFLAAMQRAVHARMSVFADAADRGDVVVMADFAQALTLDVIVETVFGAGELDRDVARDVLRSTIHAVAPAIIGGRKFHKPWFPPWRRYVRARERFDRWVDDVVAARRGRSNDGVGDDVLGVLLGARYDDGSPMEDHEIRDQLLTLLLAGHETSAIALAWAIYHLLRSPAAMAELRGELDALGPSPAPEAIVKLRYLDAVVAETLRIEPIVTDVVRVCRQPFRLGGRWTLPAGHTIAVMLISILRDERVFPQPERFRPERFLEQKFAASEFVPFGGGARRCLGAAFAEAELAIAIAEIVRSWKLTLATDEPERAIRKNLTMGPARGVRVRVVR